MFEFLPCRVRALTAVVALGGLAGCTATTDMVGTDDAKPSASSYEGTRLLPLTPMAFYQNPFHDLLENPYNSTATAEGVNDHVASVFGQLFGDDPEHSGIYVEDGDTAYISDVYHGDVRTEGVGLGMMITVQLDEQDKFDKLWRYAKTVQRLSTGTNEGYFQSHCDNNAGVPMLCVDPYGAEQFAMSLIFAHGRWGSDGAIDYEADALEVLDVMRHKQEQNGGVSEDGVTNMFDTETRLPFDVPDVEMAGQTRPSIVMPAYYDLWAQATGDAFWSDAAEAGRAFFDKAAHEKTGFMPLRAYFDGTPVYGADSFTPEGYRVLLNLVLDKIWIPRSTSAVQICERVLKTFSDLRKQGKPYVGAYSLDGNLTSMTPEESLVPLNGAAALIVSNGDRKDYIEAVWDMKTPDDKNRYYTGIMELFAVLVLSGRMQVY